jgi:hypothetical protein
VNGFQALLGGIEVMFDLDVRALGCCPCGVLCTQDSGTGCEEAKDKKSLEASGNGWKRQVLVHGSLLL